jgi:hypothetical protein
MRPTVAWLLGALPLGHRSDRLIAETLLDWEHEEATATTSWERAWVAAAGLTAVLRVFAVAAVRSGLDFQWLGGLGRRVMVVLASAFLLVALLYIWSFPNSVAHAIGIALASTPLIALGLAPAAAFLVFGWRRAGRPAPTLGAAFLCGIAVFALSVAILPATTQLFRWLYFDMLRNTLDPRGQFMATAPAGGPFPAGWVLGVLGISWLTTISIAGAATVAKHADLKSGWWLLVVPSAYSFALRATAFLVGEAAPFVASGLVIPVVLAYLHLTAPDRAAAPTEHH